MAIYGDLYIERVIFIYPYSQLLQNNVSSAMKLSELVHLS